MRARHPDRTGTVERDGVRIAYEQFGDGDPTILFLPTWSIVHSRAWKAQVPYFARHFRVLTFDGRGNGASDRPRDPSAYRPDEFAADALAVMDATSTERAFLVSLSMGAIRALHLAAAHPERVLGSVFIAPSGAFTPQHAGRTSHPFDVELDTEEGWAKYNAHYWRKDYRGFLEFFFGQMFGEPHSTKQIEDSVGWGLETDPETLIATAKTHHPSREELLGLCGRVRCPVLVIHGEEDAISPVTRGELVAAATGGDLVTIRGGGHGPHARDPVKVNALIRAFVEGRPRPSGVWTRGRSRGKRALFISSPIGLGHARRDVAIARELRELVPGLEIDWLATDPVTRVLEAEGERIHPASVHLASESKHIEEESGEHDLHVFQAWRRMDEIFAANFMLFHDVVTAEPYDLWIGDEAWEVDYHLHENPELKTAAYAWLSDFVGWLPMPDGGEREASLTADYNAEMIEQIERYPRVRDRAIFVGEPDDIVPDRFGPGLPWIRDWTEAHYDFSGYVSGFDPAALPPRESLRAELGYAPAEKVCLVSVGGSGVGEPLLRRVIDAFDEAKRRVPALRMVVVAGPRIDPAGLPRRDGLEVRPYVHRLYRHLAACDLALVQGGLTTTMELTAAQRPFLYFPLRHHSEQNFHVHHRLQRYGAGRRMDYDAATPDTIAEAVAAEIGREVRYRPVEAGGARRAAEMIAELL
ncbi:MAG: alpha/beta fold hydrolase [Gemmatimonadota bacterium]